MKKLFLFFTIVITFNSCYNVNESVPVTPENLISKAKLIDILTDIQLVEAGFSISENRNSKYKLKPAYYDFVLSTHDISLLQLKENINYYQAYPKTMEEIYDGVLANLSKIQSQVLLEKEEIDRIKDSLSVASDSLSLQKTVDSFIEE